MAEQAFSDFTLEDAAEALSYIDAHDRETWTEMARAIKSEFPDDGGFDVWDQWSQTASNYNEKSARTVWKSFKSVGGTTIATLIGRAKEHGYSQKRRASLTPAQIAAKRQAVEAQSVAHQQRQLEQHQARADVAVSIWNQARPAAEHPYLQRKGITPASAHEARVADSIPRSVFFGEGADGELQNVLLLPAADFSGDKPKIMSLQAILPTGEKFNMGGAKSSGCCGRLIGQDKTAIVIAEGYATAKAINRVTKYDVLYCFSAANVRNVARVVRSKKPVTPIILAADNDWQNELDGKRNAGVSFASEAAAEIRGHVVFPTFDGTNPQHTDWDDWLRNGYGDEAQMLEIFQQAISTPTVRQPEPELSAKTPAPVPVPANDNNEVCLTGLPHTKDKEQAKPIATIENLREICWRLGVTIRYNVFSKEEEILIPGQAFSIDNMANASISWLESWCARFKMPTDKLAGFVTYLADQNPYNPVAAWIESKPWDGQSRLADFCKTVTPKEVRQLPTGELLHEVLIRKWMISAVAGAYNPDGVSAHGVLVLQGEQYLGKTMWFKKLAPSNLRIIQDGMILQPSDRDSVKQACSFWLVELGELDATFRKADIAALKSFITKSTDVYRKPYARKESHFARRTVFFASVNPKDFLHDETGNRRFWTIECANLDIKHTIDMQQVWAEIAVLYKQGQTHYLTNEEVLTLNKHNEDFQVVDPIDERIATRLDWGNANAVWRWRTATDILVEIGVDKPSKADVSRAGKRIRQMNGNQAAKRSYGNELWVPPPKIFAYADR